MSTKFPSGRRKAARRRAGAYPGVTRLLRLASSPSTQDRAKALAGAGAPDGTLVWALRQTAGRGRLGRRWHSAPGGLYFSLVLRPPFPPSRLADFSVMAAEAAAAALARVSGLRTAVKPPNDVVAEPLPGGPLSGGPRKVCGILAEAAGGFTRLDWLVVGIGINVNNTPMADRDVLPAASLRQLTGRSRPLAPVLREVLAELHRRYRAFCLV